MCAGLNEKCELKTVWHFVRRAKGINPNDSVTCVVLKE